MICFLFSDGCKCVPANLVLVQKADADWKHNVCLSPTPYLRSWHDAKLHQVFGILLINTLV